MGGSPVSKARSLPKKPSKETNKVVLRPLVSKSDSAKKKTINLFLLNVHFDNISSSSTSGFYKL